MSRDASASPSEGEIVDSCSEKANTSTNAIVDTRVDRQSRPRISISPSPSPYRASGPRKPRVASRDRSRSPYREPRGSKRYHEGDHYALNWGDPRRFKVRYEDSTMKDKGSDRLPRGEARHRRGSDRKHQWKGDGNPLSQTRTKHELSRRELSPRLSADPRRDQDRRDNRGADSDVRLGRNHQKGIQQGFPEKYTSEQSVSNRGRAPTSIALSKQEAKTNDVQTTLNQKDDTTRNNGQAANDDLLSLDKEDNANKQPDEATLIEERRKRREAIKAKHKGQATPTLVQGIVLDGNSGRVEDISTHGKRGPKLPPNTTKRPCAVSPRASPPSNPKVSGEPGSPASFVVAQDTELANDHTVPDPARGEDEPSAADYDPTMDMQEDKLRQDQQQRQDAVMEETQRACQAIPNSEEVESKPATQQADGLDMFAEAGDMDMFAEAYSITPAAKQETKVAIPATQAQAMNMNRLDDWDDHEGYYKVILGELLDGRYHVQSNLGKGMFSGVVRATDQKTRQLVAIKVVRNNESMYKAGQKEIGILDSLRNSDPDDKKHLIRLERSFEHKGHLCMVFENLSINLREVLKKFGRDVGINLKAVRAYAQQMFLGLSLLRKCNILHADLKPDNVLVSESRNVLKICDLGSASDASDNDITQYLVSRFYRAPEIILGLPYDFAIDMWSVGCTLFELYTGKILFTGRSNNQMLRVIMECRGKFSHKILRKAQFAGYHFDDLLNFKSVEKDKLTGRDTVRLLNFAKPTRDLKTRLMSSVKGMSDAEIKEINLFTDLLDRCLSLNPEKRCTPAEALKHPFITKQKA